MDFNHWDIILFIPLAWGAFQGFRKGLIIELASIAALIAGVYVAANFSGWVETWINESLGWNESWVGWLAFIATFIGVVFGVYALAKVLEKAVNIVMLKPVNKISGAFFGLAKMFIICSIVLNLLTWVDRYLPILQNSSPQNSLLFEPMLNTAPALLPVLTETDWLETATELIDPLFVEEY